MKKSIAFILALASLSSLNAAAAGQLNLGNKANQTYERFIFHRQ